LKNVAQLVKFKTGMDVRIGYPIEKLSADSVEKVNHPMYATSVGLIGKGYEYLDLHKQSFNAEAMAPEGVTPLEADENPETKARENVQQPEEPQEKGKFFNNLKRVISDLFDENDTEIE